MHGQMSTHAHRNGYGGSGHRRNNAMVYGIMASDPDPSQNPFVSTYDIRNASRFANNVYHNASPRRNPKPKQQPIQSPIAIGSPKKVNKQFVDQDSDDEWQGRERTSTVQYEGDLDYALIKFKVDILRGFSSSEISCFECEYHSSNISIV